MSANKDLRWLKPSQLKGATRRFAEFCKADIKQQSDENKQFDAQAYTQAVKLIIYKLDSTQEAQNIGDQAC